MKFATVAWLRRSIGFFFFFFGFYKDAKSVFFHRFLPMETKDFCSFNAIRFFFSLIHRLISIATNIFGRGIKNSRIFPIYQSR